MGLAIGAPDATLLAETFDNQQLEVRSPRRLNLQSPALLHRGEEEALSLAIELEAKWLLVDDLVTRRAAAEAFLAAGVSTKVKGTLGVIVSAYRDHLLSQEDAISLIEALKLRPDIWLNADLCDQVIASLHASTSA